MNFRIRPFHQILFLAFALQAFALQAFVLLAFATVACDKPTSSVISELQIRLAAQSPNRQHVESVVVQFSEMAVRSAANSEYGTPGALPHTIDLAELGGSETRILDVFSVAEGRYDAARLKLDDVTVTLKNGSQFSEVFSPPLSVEIVVQGATSVVVERNRKADAVIDFDPMRSITLEGDTRQVHAITGFRFRPVVRLVDLASSGQVAGTVKHDNGTPSVLRDDVPLPGYPVTLFQPGETDSVTVRSDDTGRYTAFFMPAGAYSMHVPQTEETEAWSSEYVEVTTASTTRQDIVLVRR